MVLITPHLVRPLSPDEVPSLPTLPGQFLQVPKGKGIGDGVTDAPPVTPKIKKDK